MRHKVQLCETKASSTPTPSFAGPGYGEQRAGQWAQPLSECHTRKRYLRNLKDSLSLAGRTAAIRCKDTAAL